MWSGSDEEVEEFLYRCQFCPDGPLFTAAQRDEHWNNHRQESLARRSNKRHDQYVASIKSNIIKS